MRVAVTGAGGRLGGALVAALAEPRSPARPGRSPGAATRSTSTRRGRRCPPRPRPARGRRPRRGVDRRRRLRTRSGAGAPSQRDGDRGACRGLRRPRRSSSLVVSTNEVFDGDRTDGAATARTIRSPRQPVRRLEGRGRAARHGGVRGRPATGSDRPDGLAVRVARARLPEPHPRRRRAGPGRRGAAAGRRRTSGGRPSYTADVADAIVELLADDAVGGVHHLVNGGVRVQGRLGARRRRPGRASRSSSWTSRPRPGRARRDRRAGASSRHAAAVGRAAPTVAGRDGRLRPGTPPCHARGARRHGRA